MRKIWPAVLMLKMEEGIWRTSRTLFFLSGKHRKAAYFISLVNKDWFHALLNLRLEMLEDGSHSVLHVFIYSFSEQAL